MSTDKQKSLQAMRTFARDVERERMGPNSDPESSEPSQTSPEKTAKKAGGGNKSTKSKTVVQEPEKKKPKKIIKENIVDSESAEKNKKKPKHIPAFHELQKAAKTSAPTPAKSKSKKESVSKSKAATKKKGITASKTVHGGTVITDTKNKQGSFFAELGSSITSWFASIKKSLTGKKKPTYTVTKTERRKGVVQKATSKTGTIFSADSETLKEQIKARRRAENRELEDEDISWSPYTEPGYLLLEGEENESADPRVTAVSVTPKTHTMPKKPLPEPVIKKTEKIPELQPETTVQPPEPAVQDSAPKKPEPEVVSKPAVAQEEVTVVPEEPETYIEEESVEPTDPELEYDELYEEAPDDTSEESGVSLRDTNTLALLVFGILLGIGIIAYALFRIINIDDFNGPTEVEIPLAPLSVASTVTEIEVERLTYNHLLSTINRTLIENQPDQNHEYQFISPRGEVVSGDRLFEVIYTPTDGGFKNSVIHTRLVETSTGHRALLFQTTDNNAALGGMLAWETSLLADVGGLLDVDGLPPNSGTFSDIQIEGTDVRTLVLGQSTLLAYTITSGAAIIIANNVDALSEISK